MKIYLSDNSIEKLKRIIENDKPASISVRKFNPKTDSISNVVNKIKLTAALREKHKTGKSYTVYISKEIIKDIKPKYEEVKGKEGGFLPLLTLIFGGIAAAATVAGTAGGIIQGKLNADEQARHNRAKEEHFRNVELKMEGGQLSQEQPKFYREQVVIDKVPKLNKELVLVAKQGSGIKEFVKQIKFDPEFQKQSKRFFKALKPYVIIKKRKNGIYLKPKL